MLQLPLSTQEVYRICFGSFCHVGCAGLIRTFNLFNQSIVMISCDRCANTTNSEFCVLLSFGVSGCSKLISVCIIWKEMIKIMGFFTNTYSFILISFKAYLMFVLKLQIEKGNTVFIQWYSIKLIFSFFIKKTKISYRFSLIWTPWLNSHPSGSLVAIQMLLQIVM